MAEGLPRRRLRRREEEEDEAKKVEEGRSSRRIKDKKPSDNGEKKEKGNQSKRSDEKEAAEPGKTSVKTSELDLKKLTTEGNFPSIGATEKKDFELADGLMEKDLSVEFSQEVTATNIEMGPKLEAMEVDTKPIEEEIESKDGEVEGKEEEKWVKGEKILCFHGPLIYEAKIQEVEMQNSIPK